MIYHCPFCAYTDDDRYRVGYHIAERHWDEFVLEQREWITVTFVVTILGIAIVGMLLYLPG